MDNQTPSTPEQASYYDERWIRHHYANRLKLARAAAILQELHALGLDQPKIIDLGSGSGWLTAILGQFGPTKGVELSPKAVEVAASRYPFAKFSCVDLKTWKAESDDYDVVVSQEVIEHFGDADQQAHLMLVSALLRPGGFVIMTTPNAHTMRAMSAADRASWTDQPIENWRSLGELRKLIGAAGLQVVSMYTIINRQGEGGLRRILGSTKLHVLTSGVGASAALESLRRRLHHGLHIVAVARKAGR